MLPAAVVYKASNLTTVNGSYGWVAMPSSLKDPCLQGSISRWKEHAKGLSSEKELGYPVLPHNLSKADLAFNSGK